MYFDDGEGNKYYVAYFDGYAIGERLLEGVIFKGKIIKNKLIVSYPKADEGYMNQLNKKLWLGCAKDHFITSGELSEKPNGGKTLVLILKEKKK